MSEKVKKSDRFIRDIINIFIFEEIKKSVINDPKDRKNKKDNKKRISRKGKRKTE